MTTKLQKYRKRFLYKFSPPAVRVGSCYYTEVRRNDYIRLYFHSVYGNSIIYSRVLFTNSKNKENVWHLAEFTQSARIDYYRES